MSASDGKRTKAKPTTIGKALDYCSGCVSATTLRDARSLYSVLSGIAKELGSTLKEQLKAQTKDIKFRHLTDEDRNLGGALFVTLYSADDRVNLTDVWPNYQFLIEVYKRHKGISSARVKVEGNMDLRETKNAIIEMLELFQASGYDKKKIREARKQYETIMTNQLSSFALELQTLQEKHKKTIIEPQHVPAQHRRRAPELHEIVAEAWGNRLSRAEEAVKDLYLIMEAHSRVKEKTLSTPTYDDAKSTRTSTASSSVSSTTRLSTTSIESVLKRCAAKYNRDLLKKAENELKQLKKLDRDIKYRSDLEKRKYQWHMKGSEGPTELLKSISKPERPLHVVLLLAKDDGIEGSEYALLEYGSLLHSEKLFNETENPTGLSEHAVGTSVSVYEPTERNSVEDILHSMRKVVNKEVYAQAKEEYKKLQEIEKMLARDDVLRARKDHWKIYVRDGPHRYIDVEIPNRPLHIVLNRAHNEGVKGSDFALMDYGSMLHSEVLYESKDNMPQIVPMPQELKKTEDNQARPRTIVHVDKEPDALPIGQDREPNRKERERARYDEEQLFKLQSEIDKLKEQLNIKNSEVEDLTSRLSQAASNSLMHNNPSIADLSDKNRPTKLGERFGQLYDSEWSDAHETLKLTISSENDIFLILADFVKDIFRYCEEALRQQITDIKHDLENRTREPNFYYNTKKFHAIGKTDEMLSWTCEKYATEFQKGNAMYSVQGLTKIYKDYCKHRRFLDKHPRVIEKIDPYIDVTVEICWLMCAQTPPMQLVFAERNSKVDKSYFRCMGHSGNTVDICIWPAVLLHDGGPVVMKGQVLPL